MAKIIGWCRDVGRWRLRLKKTGSATAHVMQRRQEAVHRL